MAANAILKTIKSDISWTKCAKKANEATFPTKFGNPYLMEIFLFRSETILTYGYKMAAQKWTLTPYLNTQTVISLESDVLLTPIKCHFPLILALQI